ncbi:MAG: hypothetical protein ACREOI_37485, partial [bacterium]
MQKLAGNNRRSMSQDQSQKREVGLQQFSATGSRISDAFFAASNEDIPILETLFKYTLSQEMRTKKFAFAS